MAQPAPQFTKPSDFVVDAIVVGAFFVFMFTIVRSHVPSNDPKMILLWGALASACMSGVFWLALWMFRVVLRYQKELQARK